MKDLTDYKIKIATILAHVEEYDLLPPDTLDIKRDKGVVDATWHLTGEPSAAKAVLRSFGVDTWVVNRLGGGPDMYLTRDLDGGELTVFVCDGVVEMKPVIL